LADRSRHVAGGDTVETATERQVREAIQRHLGEDDVLISGLRLHDNTYGDVEIDLIVLMPNAGVGIVEVKGGTITYADGTWHQSGKEGTKEIDPAPQARRGWHAFRRFIERQPAWSRGRLRGDWFLAFPQTHVPPDEDMGPEGRRETIIAEGEELEAAYRIWEFLARPQDKPLPAPGWVDQILELIHGQGDGPLSVEQRVAQRLRDIEEMSATQTTLVKSWRRNRMIDVAGGAGTGKTWLAMEQARQWSKDGLAVAFLSYTKGVAEMVKRTMAELPEKEQPAYIGTLHALGYHWGVKPTNSEKQGPHYWDQDLPLQYIEAASKLTDDAKFDAVVIDEAQDFADSWWDVIWAIAKNPDDLRLAVFRDDSQSVFQGRLGRPDIPMASFDLDTNYRNGRQIVEAFTPLCDRKMVVEGGEGLPVRFIFTDEENVIEAADDTVQLLTEQEGWLPEHVALLTTKGRHPVHAERSDADRDAYWQDLWSSDDVFYSTVSGFKGLERPAVVIAVNGFHEEIDPKDVLYTALSRALDLAVIVGERTQLEQVLGEKHLRRMERRQA
jgi:ATP:corrinoid adenosyltransferase